MRATRCRPGGSSTNAPLKDPLRQNQFGLSIGGPIVSDRTFWFGSFERTQLDRTGIVTIAPVAVAAINRALDAVGYRGPRVTTGNYPTGYNSTNVFGRVDHQATPSAHLQLRYSLYNVAARTPATSAALNDVSRGAALDDTDQTVAASFLSTLSSGMINEARAQYTRSDLAAPVNDIIGPAVNVSGVASWGTATFSPTARVLDVVQAVDTLTLQRGDHLVKAGGDLLYNRVHDRVSWGAPGRLLVHVAGELRARHVFDVSSRRSASRRNSSRIRTSALFVQDEWRLRHDRHGERRAALRSSVAAAAGPARRQQRLASSGHRVRAGRGKTVIRASGGLYFDRIPLRATSNALQRDGSKYQVAQLSFAQPALRSGRPCCRRFQQACSRR